MNKSISLKKKLASLWFYQLQKLICNEFEKLEKDFGKKTNQKPKAFKKKLEKN